MSKIIVANWKMNPMSSDEAVALAKASDEENLIIAPPFPFLAAVAAVLKQAKLGAQDLFWENQGAYTGEISGSQLAQIGVQYVIVGHSERRGHLGETDEMVTKKFLAALKNNLTPILCVGETKAEREAGETREILNQQLKFMARIPKDTVCIVAYEPVWAIGTGMADKPADTIEIIAMIRKNLENIKNLRIIYGGSVTSANAESFFKHKEIEGALVGGASLKPEEIKKIVKITNQNAN